MDRGSPTDPSPTVSTGNNSSSSENNVTDGRGVVVIERSHGKEEEKTRNGVHKMLGGGIVADVILWRRSDITVGILSSTVGTYLFFRLSGQTLLSFSSKVALLLTSLLFFWSKAATLLRRQLPPLPEMTISEESMNAFASRLRSHLNGLLATVQEIARGRETNLFLTIATCLSLLSIIGNFLNFLTFAFTSLAVILTVPALCDKYEDRVESGIMFAKQGYEILEAAYANIIKSGIGSNRKVC